MLTIILATLFMLATALLMTLCTSMTFLMRVGKALDHYLHATAEEAAANAEQTHQAILQSEATFETDLERQKTALKQEQAEAEVAEAEKERGFS